MKYDSHRDDFIRSAQEENLQLPTQHAFSIFMPFNGFAALLISRLLIFRVAQKLSTKVGTPLFFKNC